MKRCPETPRGASEQGRRESRDLTPLVVAGRAARAADTVLTVLAAFSLAILFLFACYALWDTWRIYDRAGVDETLLQYKPQLDGDQEGDGFAELMALNPDVCAWLTVEDTPIDYPVVRGDDNVTYVNTDVYGEFSLSGSIFLDYRNARDFTDSYSLIYGHHMEGGVMFGALASFAEQDYFQDHATGTLYLPDRTCRIDFFACFQTDAYDERVFTPGNLSGSELSDLLAWVREHALQYREIGVTEQDQILALSTCSEASTNARTILMGRLEPFYENEGGD